MILGEIEGLTLNLNPEEINILLDQYYKQKIINIMGKRYFISGIDCAGKSIKHSGEYKTKVKIRVRKIQKV